MKKIILIVLVLLYALPCFAYEDFTSGWTETDPGSWLTVAAAKVTFTNATLDRDADMSKNSWAGFAGDFDVAFDAKFTSGNDAEINFIGVYPTGYSQILVVAAGNTAGGATYVKIVQSDFDTINVEDSTALLSEDTVYYFRLVRVEATGTYGTVYLRIYPTAQDRNDDTNEIDTLGIALEGSKPDYTILLVASTYDIDYNTTSTSGYVENLDLAYVPVSETSSQLITVW